MHIPVFTADANNKLGRESTLVGYAQLQGCFTHTELHRVKNSPILSILWFHLKIEFIALP